MATTLFKFVTADEDSVSIAEDTLESATWAARGIFEETPFKLESSERHPDWDDFEEVNHPTTMLKREDDDASIPGKFFIEPYETKEVEGFHELAKNGHVWTVLDCDGDLWIAPGYHFVNRYAYIVTKHPHHDKSPTYLFA